MSEENERLFPYEDVSDERIKKIFFAYDNILTDEIIPVNTGRNTSNYKIQTRARDYLLKIYPESNDHSEIEIALYRYASSIIQVPEIYLCDDSKKIIRNTYAIMQYVGSISLRDYIVRKQRISNSHMFKIGKMLAILHEKKFPCTAFVDANLYVKEEIMPIEKQYEYYLNGWAGIHLDEKLKKRLTAFIDKNASEIQQISSEIVLCHGDFIPSNILIDSFETPWFIDFEYSLAASKYCDIGKFFRTRDNFSEYIHEATIKAFSEGYNETSTHPLPDNWYRLSKIADIVSMLSFINRQEIPTDWITDIEEEIEMTMTI